LKKILKRLCQPSLPEPKDINKEDTESEEEETTADRFRKGDENVQMPPPKRSKSSYLFYTLDKRPEVMEKYPGIDGKEILIRLGKMWRKTSYEEREPYEKMYLADSERYTRQMEEYEKTGKYHDEEGNIDRSQFFGKPTSRSVSAQARRKASLEKDTQEVMPTAHKKPQKSTKREEVQYPPPRRNLSGYTFYTLEKRPEVMEENPGIDGKEILIKLGKMWQKTSDKEREPYEKKYEADRKRYERQMLEYEKTGRYYNDEGNIDRSQLFGKRRSTSRSVAAMAKRKAMLSH